MAPGLFILTGVLMYCFYLILGKIKIATSQLAEDEYVSLQDNVMWNWVDSNISEGFVINNSTFNTSIPLNNSIVANEGGRESIGNHRIINSIWDHEHENVNEILSSSGFMSEADIDAGDTLNKKVRNAQLSQFNYILVVGDKEKTSRTVNVRTRDNKVHGEMSIDELIQHLRKLQAEKTLSDDSDLLK